MTLKTAFQLFIPRGIHSNEKNSYDKKNCKKFKVALEALNASSNTGGISLELLRVHCGTMKIILSMSPRFSV